LGELTVFTNSYIKVILCVLVHTCVCIITFTSQQFLCITCEWDLDTNKNSPKIV